MSPAVSTSATSRSKAGRPPSLITSMRPSRSARAPTAYGASASSSPGTPSLLRTEVGALSQEQRAELAVYGARWNALRQSTSPPDEAAARVAVDKAYAAAGLPPPGEIVWEDGPAELAVSWSRRRHLAGESVRALVVDGVRRKTELAVDRAIALSVRMALSAEPGLARLPPYCASI